MIDLPINLLDFPMSMTKPTDLLVKKPKIFQNKHIKISYKIVSILIWIYHFDESRVENLYRASLPSWEQ